MLALLLSPASIMNGSEPFEGIVAVLREIAESKVGVLIVSNHSKPAWFDALLGGTDIEFFEAAARQNGEVVRLVAKHLKIPVHDVLVSAANEDDLQMGKNGGAVVLSAQWSMNATAKHLGIDVATPAELNQLVQLTNQWSGGWWFKGDGEGYRVRVLSDLSSLGKPMTQREFSERVTKTVKNGGPQLSALLTATARSLLSEGIIPANSLFGVYPSSSSDNTDTEVLSDFTHRLRTTVARTRFAKRGYPLFIRSQPAIQRHSTPGTDREDPTDQVRTLHLNPFYKTRLRGRHVLVVDDCTTYGVSFGVAAAFLKKGGAASVTAVALGKFGNPAEECQIVIEGDPFGPTTVTGHSRRRFTEVTNLSAQNLLRSFLTPQ